MQGSCNCGRVSFDITASPKDIYVCHCSICRRYTGSSSIPVVIVANSDFQWRSGQSDITHWSKPDGDWQAHFCRHCGSSLPGPNDPDRMFVPAGLITTGDEDLKIAHHIWTESKAPWDHIPKPGQQHPQAYGTGKD